MLRIQQAIECCGTWRHRCRLLVVVACWLGMLLAANEVWGQRRTDTIQLIEGAPLRGEVVRTTPDEVEVSQGGATRQVAVSEISQILFGDEPSALRGARDAALKKQWEQASQGLDRISADDMRGPWIDEDVQFYRAYIDAQVALEKGARIKESVAAMLNFVKQHRNSRHTYAAAEVLGQLAQRLGRPDRAAQFFSQLANATDSVTRARGQLLQADMLRWQGKDHAAEALQRYEEAIRAQPAKGPIRRTQSLAIIGKSRCLALLGRATEGIPLLESLIADHPADDAELFAQAYLALGDCYAELEQTQDAVLALLHVDLLFQDQSEAHAEALYRLGQLWPQLGKPDRAADARNRLQTLYPGTRWAQP